MVQAIASCERERALLGDGVGPVLARTRALLQLGAEAAWWRDARRLLEGMGGAGGGLRSES